MNARRALLPTIALACALCAVPGIGVRAAVLDGQVVAGARVAAIADRVAHGLVSGPDRSIAPAYTVADQNLPSGAVEIVPGGSPFVTATYVSVPVGIRVGGKLARTVVAGYRVTSYLQTAVAGRDLTPGAVIVPGDLVLARIASNGRPAVGLDALLGRRLNSATPKGAPLYLEQTASNTVVKAGQAALLVIRDGGVVLSVDVVARTGGAIGDAVTVINPQTQKAIGAIVTGPNRVELTLPGGEQQ